MKDVVSDRHVCLSYCWRNLTKMPLLLSEHLPARKSTEVELAALPKTSRDPLSVVSASGLGLSIFGSTAFALSKTTTMIGALSQLSWQVSTSMTILTLLQVDSGSKFKAVTTKSFITLFKATPYLGTRTCVFVKHLRTQGDMSFPDYRWFVPTFATGKSAGVPGNMLACVSHSL